MGGMRKPKAKKRPGKVGRVNKFKNSAGTGCGTGAGGFKAGNNCQKEDGVPNKTQSPYSALKQPNAKAAKQKAAAMKQKAAIKQAKKLAKDKQTSIQAKQKKAALRKKEKEAKAAEEAKQRAEALAKKKAEMLKVIRKKRANEKLNIIGEKTFEVAPSASVKPTTTSAYSGKADPLAKRKLPGETQVDFVIRQRKADFETLHKRLDQIDSEYKAKISEAAQAVPPAREVASSYDYAVRQLAKKYESKPPKGKELETVDEFVERIKKSKKYGTDKDLDAELDAAVEARARARQQLADAKKRVKDLEAEQVDRIHREIGSFSLAHSEGAGLARVKGTIKVDAEESSPLRGAAAKAASEAEDFFEKTASAKIAQSIAGATMSPRGGGGGHYEGVYFEGRRALERGEPSSLPENKRRVVIRRIVVGVEDADAARTVVHEIGHAIHDGAGMRAGVHAKAVRAVAEDYRRRLAEFRAKQPVDTGVVRGPQEGYSEHYSAPGRPAGHPPASVLGYARRYSDFHFTNRNANPIATIESQGTEVISTGVEVLFVDPARMRIENREHFDMTVSFLAGFFAGTPRPRRRTK